MSKTHRDKIAAAVIAWSLAIKAKIVSDHSELPGVRYLAAQYGASITDKACLDEVQQWFDWELISGYLSPQPDAPGE